jgi:enamine deaminase RidA (YjgF/YER057c/UK114 family)
VGNLLYVSGTGSVGEEMGFKGKLGGELSTIEGYQAARVCALNILSTLKNELGDLDKVVRIVKLVGMINSTEEFGDHSVVMNGASDLFVQVFGEKGKHARSVAGVAALPSNIAVEVDAVVEVA